MLARHGVLTEAEGDCVAVERPQGKSAALLVCEHASPRLPAFFGDLGLPAEALRSHIAWDPGALAVSEAISARLDATLVHQRFSRLIYDCNRPPEAVGAMPEVSEVYPIPGNRGLDEAQRRDRTEALYVPFHARIRELIADRGARGQATVIVTIHSFTPVYMGHRRSVELGILHDEDSHMADRMLSAAEAEPKYRTERNEPYGPKDGVTHTLKLHGIANGLENVMIEIRNDLIVDGVSQGVMADYLSGLIQHALEVRS